MNIDVVLMQDDEKLGKRGEVVRVSSGYAQNFLYPHHKAKPATPVNLKAFEAEKARQAKDRQERLARAKDAAARLAEASVTIEVLTGEGDKLYGAVTTQDIASAAAAQRLPVEKKDIHLEEPIKKLGAYQVSVKLHPDISANLKLWVVKKK